MVISLDSHAWSDINGMFMNSGLNHKVHANTATSDNLQPRHNGAAAGSKNLLLVPWLPQCQL